MFLHIEKKQDQYYNFNGDVEHYIFYLRLADAYLILFWSIYNAYSQNQ